MDINKWLEFLDEMPLECDGLTRVTSLLLSRQSIGHTIHVGQLDVKAVGHIPLHFWIELEDGRTLDLRARMWLNLSSAVHHGLGNPDANHVYRSTGTIDPAEIPEILFPILTGSAIELFPLLTLSVARQASPALPHPLEGTAPDGSSIAENFNKWFGKSVVARDGAPVVLHHSTAEVFTIFSHNKWDVGIHLGNEDQAIVRKEHRSQHGLDTPESQRTLLVYARIENPLRLPDSGDWDIDEMKHHLARVFPADRHIYGSVDYDDGFKDCDQVRRYLQDKGYDGIVYSNTGEVPGADLLQLRAQRRQNELYQRFPEAMGRVDTTIQASPEYKRYCQAKADESAFREANGRDSYIVFSPNQIKSVHNNGLFDIDCDDFTDETSRRNSPRSAKMKLRS